MNCLQLDFVLLITALWAQPLSQFSVHLTAYLPNLYYVYEDAKEDSVKSLTKTEVNDTHCSLPSYQASHLTAEGHLTHLTLYQMF